MSTPTPHNLTPGHYLRTPSGWRKVVAVHPHAVEVVPEAPLDDRGDGMAGAGTSPPPAGIAMGSSGSSVAVVAWQAP